MVEPPFSWDLLSSPARTIYPDRVVRPLKAFITLFHPRGLELSAGHAFAAAPEHFADEEADFPTENFRAEIP